MKKQGVFSMTMETMVCIVACLTVFAYGINVCLLRNAATDQIKQECAILDRALETYATYHRSVDEASVHVTEDGKTHYASRRTYPETLAELGELQTAGYLPHKMDLTKYRYKTSDQKTTYALEVTLPDGTVYKSSGSK